VTAVYDAAWYDEVLVEDGSPAMEPLEESPWAQVYLEISQWIDPHEEVVDLGCGTGRFLEQLYRRDHYARVTGVDWSAAALAEAGSYAKPRHPDAPPPKLVLQDLAEWEPEGERAGNTVFTCMEVLEHLEDDLGLVRRVPPGHRFLVSLPNFWSESHVRTFPDPRSVWQRYGGLLHFRRWVMVGSDRQGIHILETRRRGDSW
jgi:trans-aconitate methyltransferase